MQDHHHHHPTNESTRLASLEDASDLPSGLANLLLGMSGYTSGKDDISFTVLASYAVYIRCRAIDCGCVHSKWRSGSSSESASPRLSNVMVEPSLRWVNPCDMTRTPIPCVAPSLRNVNTNNGSAELAEKRTRKVPGGCVASKAAARSADTNPNKNPACQRSCTCDRSIDR